MGVENIYIFLFPFCNLSQWKTERKREKQKEWSGGVKILSGEKVLLFPRDKEERVAPGVLSSHWASCAAASH
jgi:hypothetical protein